MTDWSSEDLDRIVKHAARVSTVLRELDTRYHELDQFVVAGTRPQPAPGPRPSNRPMAGSQAPIDVDVLASRSNIAKFAQRAATATDRIRNGQPAPGISTSSALHWVADHLRGTYTASITVGDWIGRDAWALHEHAGMLLGTPSRAFPADEPCSACGVRSLWVDPASMKIACGMPTCRHEQPLQTPLLLDMAAATYQRTKI